MCDCDAGRAPVHQFWWLHDARWYQGVAKRFGQDVANEINAEALRFVARRVAAWCAREYGARVDELAPEELFPLLRQAVSTMWTDDMVTVEHAPDGDDGWETVVSNAFLPRMLRAAGSLDGYECACLQTRAGWFEGLGLEVQDSRLECRLSGGRACRFRTIPREAS